jgi:hypothetical protein
LSRMARRVRRKSAQDADRLHPRRRLQRPPGRPSRRRLARRRPVRRRRRHLHLRRRRLPDQRPHHPATGHSYAFDTRVADAVLDMARAYLAAKGGRDPRPTVVVHTDARVLFGDDGWAETTGSSALAVRVPATARWSRCHLQTLCNGLKLCSDETLGQPIDHKCRLAFRLRSQLIDGHPSLGVSPPVDP